MNNLAEDRAHFQTLGAIYHAHEDVKIEKTAVAGVDTYRFTPPHVVSMETIIHLHGGAYLYGSIQSHKAMVSHLAAATGRVILYIEYSLAPEHPFPKALNETTAVIQELLRIDSHFTFALMGDSAGGNLVMSTALNLKRLDMPAPLYQVLISPWLNLRTTAPSYIENEKNDPILTKAFIDYAATHYTTPENFSNPLVSSLLGAFEDFNPTLILVGNQEILRDDSLQLHQVLQQAGSISQLEVYENVPHVWLLTNITSPEAVDAFRMIREFVDGIQKFQNSTFQISNLDAR